MKRHRHTPDQVVCKLAEGERILNGGGDLAAVLRTLEISEATWNRWRSQYGAMKASEAKRLKELEAENARLKKLVANQALDIDMLKELARESSDPGPLPQGRWASAATVRGLPTTSMSRDRRPSLNLPAPRPGQT